VATKPSADPKTQQMTVSGADLGTRSGHGRDTVWDTVGTRSRRALTCTYTQKRSKSRSVPGCVPLSLKRGATRTARVEAAPLKNQKLIDGRCVCVCVAAAPPGGEWQGAGSRRSIGINISDPPCGDFYQKTKRRFAALTRENTR